MEWLLYFHGAEETQKITFEIALFQSLKVKEWIKPAATDLMDSSKFKRAKRLHNHELFKNNQTKGYTFRSTYFINVLINI